MILTLDVGNTNVLLGVFNTTDNQDRNARLPAQQKSVSSNCQLSTVNSPLTTARLFTAAWRTEHEWAALLRETVPHHLNITGAILSCVVPPVTTPLLRATELAFGVKPLVVGPGLKTGLKIAIDDPATLGGDMVCNAVAALTHAKPPIVVIDMGTATTVSVVDASGAFVGGAIIPGVYTSLNALCEKANLLPHISLESPKAVVGRNTVDCMQSGMIYSTASIAEGMIDRIEGELGAPVTSMITGGISGMIAPHIRKPHMHLPNLLIEGLRLLYERNR